MEDDRRSFRVALVNDEYVNPEPRDSATGRPEPWDSATGRPEPWDSATGRPEPGLDGLGVLAAAGWGVMALPAADYPQAVVEALLAEVADQAEEFARHGYDLVLVGRPNEALVGALRAAGLPVPDCVAPKSAGELRDFLDSRPLPRALADRRY